MLLEPKSFFLLGYGRACTRTGGLSVLVVIFMSFDVKKFIFDDMVGQGPELFTDECFQQFINYQVLVYLWKGLNRYFVFVLLLFSLTCDYLATILFATYEVVLLKGENFSFQFVYLSVERIILMRDVTLKIMLNTALYLLDMTRHKWPKHEDHLSKTVSFLKFLNEILVFVFNTLDFLSQLLLNPDEVPELTLQSEHLHFFEFLILFVDHV